MRTENYLLTLMAHPSPGITLLFMVPADSWAVGGWREGGPSHQRGECTLHCTRNDAHFGTRFVGHFGRLLACRSAGGHVHVASGQRAAGPFELYAIAAGGRLPRTQRNRRTAWPVCVGGGWGAVYGCNFCALCVSLDLFMAPPVCHCVGVCVCESAGRARPGPNGGGGMRAQVLGVRTHQMHT